jgi:hypothetical protein
MNSLPLSVSSPRMGNGKRARGGSERCKDRLRVFVEEWETFGPARGHIGEGQGRERAAFTVSTVMGDEIDFEKSWLRVVPAMKGANGDLLFEQRSSLGGGKPTRTGSMVRAQEALGSGGAHLKQEASALLTQVEMSVPLQRRHQSGKIRDETFGTDLLGRSPGLKQGVLHLLAIARLASTPDGVLALRSVVEQSNGICAGRAGHGHDPLKQQPFLGQRGRIAS